MKLRSLLTAFLITLFFSHTTIAASALTFDGAWIAEAPPSSRVMVAYMKINNSGDQVAKIVSASSESYQRISFHQTQNENDMAKMKHMSTLTIPAKGQLILKAGSHHIMLFNPVKKLKAGDQVNLELKLENGDVTHIIVPVKKQPMDHSHMHH